MKKITILILSAAMILAAVMGFAACGGKEDKPEKYDVAIKVANNYGQEWIFTPDVDELYYEFEYTGEEMTFGVDAYYVYGDPQVGDRWLNCAGASVSSFKAVYWYKNLNGETSSPRIIKDKGEYSIHYMTNQASWNYRSVRLYITVK